MTSHARQLERSQRLARLLPIRRALVADGSLAAHEALVAYVRRALRRERQRGLANAWSYHPQRHASLLKAYREEAAALASRRRRGRS